MINIYTSPSTKDVCDRCGGELMQRADDNEETISNRLNVYDAQTKPLVEHYAKLGILLTVDADDTVDAVFERLDRALTGGA